MRKVREGIIKKTGYWLERDEWFEKKDVSVEDSKILIFSPCYAVGHSMRLRIVDYQFLKICNEATLWMYLENISPV